MKPKAYYNKNCSICRLEINHYKKKCENIQWIDINNSNEFKNKNIIEKNKFLRRIHIQHNNQILIGVDAFIFIWSKIPRYKIFSKLLKLPIIYQFSFLAYEILAFLLYIKNYQQFNK